MSNLITIDEFKTYKQINSQTEDPTISFIIAAVSEFISEYIGRDLTEWANKDKTEHFDATMYDRYFPKVFPLLSVTSVSVSTDGGVTFTELVADTSYFVDLEEDSIIANTGLTGFVSSSKPHYSGRIIYKGGYLKVPYDVKLAALDLVEYHRKKEHVSSKSVQSSSVENPVNIIVGSQLPPHIKRILDQYRVL